MVILLFRLVACPHCLGGPPEHRVGCGVLAAAAVGFGLSGGVSTVGRSAYKRPPEGKYAKVSTVSTRSSFRGSTRTPSFCSCDHVRIWSNGVLSADCHAARTHASAGRSDQPYARRPRDGRRFASQARRNVVRSGAQCSARPLAPSLAAAAGDTSFSVSTIGRSSSRRGSSRVAGGWTRAHGCGALHRCRRGCPPGSQAAHPLHFGHCLAARQ